MWEIHLARPFIKLNFMTSGQDGGIGRHTSPPHITTKRIATKSQNNTQNCQKIKLYGSLTTKDLKKPNSSKQVGGAETQRQGREMRRYHVARRGSGCALSSNSVQVLLAVS